MGLGSQHERDRRSGSSIDSSLSERLSDAAKDIASSVGLGGDIRGQALGTNTPTEVVSPKALSPSNSVDGLHGKL